jgi:hypothetical protein
LRVLPVTAPLCLRADILASIRRILYWPNPKEAF